MSLIWKVIVAIFITISDANPVKDWCYELADNKRIMKLTRDDCDELSNHYVEIEDLRGITDESLSGALGIKDKALFASLRLKINKALKAQRAQPLQQPPKSQAPDNGPISGIDSSPKSKPRGINGNRISGISLMQSRSSPSQFNYDSENWMKNLVESNPAYDNMYITEINIPGTHESAARWGALILGVKFVVCQAYTLTEQLEMGYRFFDIRLKYEKSKGGMLTAYHQKAEQKTNLEKISHEIGAFLYGKEECVILKIKNEAGKDKAQKFAQHFVVIMNKFRDMYIWKGQIPRLRDCKGQIVVMTDDKYKYLEPSHSWTNILIQNNHNLIGFSDHTDPGEGHAVAGTEEGLWYRYTTFTSHIQTTIEESHMNLPMRIYRSRLNANSGSRMKSKELKKKRIDNSGSPLRFAQRLNVPIAKYLLDTAFTINDQQNSIYCNGVFIGIPQFDFPRTEEKFNLIPWVLARIIIDSNCNPGKHTPGKYPVIFNDGSELLRMKRELPDIQKPTKPQKAQALYVTNGDTYYDQDSYEENGQDLYGYTDIAHHNHEIGTDYDFEYNHMPQGRYYHDTVSDGHYHEYGEYDNFHNDSDYLAIFAVGIMIFICICCPMVIISVICGIAAGKFYLITNRYRSRCKHPFGGNSYDQVDIDSEHQV